MSRIESQPYSVGGASAATGWVVFGFEGHWYAVPQDGVRVITETLDHWQEEDAPIPAWVDPQSGWPAYRVDAQLHPVAGDKRRFAVLVEAVPRPMGILTDFVQVLSPTALHKRFELPPILRSSDHAGTGLLRLDQDRLAATLDPVLLALRLDAELRRGDA